MLRVHFQNQVANVEEVRNPDGGEVDLVDANVEVLVDGVVAVNTKNTNVISFKCKLNM